MAIEVEVERKFEVPEGWECPAEVGEYVVGAPKVVKQNATYLDTPDLALLEAKHTLRRRTGGSDAGWHLKAPRNDEARTEHRAPLGHSMADIPAELRDNVDQIVGNQPLLPVAELRTERTERVVRSAEGEAVATLVDDVVSAQVRGGESHNLAWREVELELVGGEVNGHLDALASALAESGLTPSDSPSKLARVLEPAVHEVRDRQKRLTQARKAARGEAAAATSKEAKGKGKKDAPKTKAQDLIRKEMKLTLTAMKVGTSLTAGEIVREYLVTQVGTLQALEDGVRDDAPDAVHKSRVATRRLRSTLKTFAPLFEGEAADDLRRDVAWWTSMLGGPRDAEVLQTRVMDAVAQVDRRDRVGPVTTRARASLKRQHKAAHQAVTVALDGKRYRTLLASIMAFVAAPPWSEMAQRPAGQVLPKLVEGAAKKVKRRAKAVAKIEDRAHREEAIHDLRKLAKAARYATEAARPVLGPDAARALDAWVTVQEVLGDFQDSVVARQALLGIMREAKAAGEDTFTYGVLAEREKQVADGLRARFDEVLSQALKASKK